MRNLQLLFALFLVPFMAQSQRNLFIKYDSSCMDRYEYQLGDNPNVKSFVTYSVKANRNEKVVLEVGIESIKMQSKLPKGARLKSCKSQKFNQKLVNRINNQQTKVYVVRVINGKYNLSPVSIASLSRESKGQLTFIGNNYNFTFNPNKHSTGDNLSGKSSDSDIFYHGKGPYQCSEAIKFQRVPIEICCCSFTDLVYVPKIGMIMEQGGNPSEGTRENALNLRAINGVPFGQYMADACAPPTPPAPPVEEVIVSREPAPVSYEQTPPPPAPTVNYGMIVPQSAPPKQTVAFVPYELMVVEQETQVQPVNYGMIKQQEAEPEPVPYEVVTTVLREGNIPKPCAGEASAGTHIIQPGESLYGIARMYGANVKNLQTWNKLKKDEVIHPCTRLFVVPPPSSNTITETYTTRSVEPVTYETTQERRVLCNEVSTERAHVVQQGETLNQIAKRYGLTIAQLKAWNNIADINYLKPCSKLAIRATEPVSYDRIVLKENVKPVSRCAEQSTQGTHVVQPKENLNQIAALYGLSVNDLKKWNNINNVYEIPVCTRLRLVPNTPVSYEVVTERVVPQSRCAEQSTQGTHVVQPKENLNQIAALYGLSVNNLKKWNGITNVTNIPVCTRLRLVPNTPTSYEVVTESVVPQSRCAEQSTQGTHVVQPKENLNQIAALYGLSVNDLKKWNAITNVTNIPVCSRLRLVPNRPASYEVVTEKVVPQSRCAEQSTQGTHVVQPKENLNQIAALYGLSVNDLKKWNAITNVTNIPVCSRLRLVPNRPASYEVVTEKVVPQSRCAEQSTQGTHVVQPKENLNQIAALYGLSVNDLKKWNAITNVTNIPVCSRLRLVPNRPASYEVMTEKVVPKSRCAEQSTQGTHVVQPKENLTQIAALYGLSIQQLRTWNKLSNKDVIPICTRLRLVPPAPTPASYEVTSVPTSRCAEQSTQGTHVVQPKETLNQIAALYSLSAKNLKKWNNIANEKNIPICTRLRLVPPAPAPVAYEVTTERVVPQSKCPQSSMPGMHIVQPKETLNQIAVMYNLTIEQLKAWNNIDNKNVISVCSELRLVPPAPKSYEVVTERIVNNPVPARKRCAEKSTPGTHVIQPQETLAEIAALYGLSMQELRKWNKLTSVDNIPSCTKLRLVAPAPTSYDFTEKRPTKCKEKSSQGQHVVQSGETLYAISKKYKVTIKDLQAWNGFGNTTYLAPCMKVYTRRPASYGQTVKAPVNVAPTQTRITERKTVVVPSVPMDCNAKSSDGIHVVRTGESLYSLSKKYKISIAQLQSLNGLGSSENIVPCMKLITKATKPKSAVKSYDVVRKTRLVPAAQAPTPATKPQPKETLTTRSTTYNTNIKCPKSKTPGIHVVQFNETLSNISNLYGISIAQLRAWNGMNEGDILRVCTPLTIIRPASYEVKTGRVITPSTTNQPNTTTIVVPSTGEFQPKNYNQSNNRTTINIPNTQTSSDGRRVHTVREGETIESIARTYKIAPERLRSANLMDEKELITAGQKLYLN